MGIKIYLYIYILFIFSISLFSYKKGIYLIWLTILFIPTVILERSINLGLSMMTILVMGSVVFELKNKERRHLWITFINDNQRAVILYFIISLFTVFFSQTVPITYQFRYFFVELTILVFSIQTVLCLRDNKKAVSVLKLIVVSAIIYNLLFCIIFELIIGVNPAGMPLYIMLGIDDNQFITDMIDYERGNLSFRAQTVYRHPLSLGQYMLVLLPLFLTKGNRIINLILVAMICFIVVLTGSRGAIFPLVLIILISQVGQLGNILRKLVFLLPIIVLMLCFIPSKIMNDFDKSIEPYIVSLQFWDDQKQKDSGIEGSSMELRINQFEAALDEISDNPILGRGYGYRDYWIEKHNDLHPELLGFESILLLYLVERGWLGLVYFFLLSIYVYKKYKGNTSDKSVIMLIFLGFMMSIVMTGIRPLTILFVCLSSSIVCGTSPKHGNLSGISI